MAAKTCSLLVGRQEICNYLKISKKVFYDFVAAGMPVKKVGKNSQRWIAHCEQIEEWGRKISSVESN